MTCILAPLILLAVPVADGADISIHNALTGGPDMQVCRIDVDGLSIGVVWRSTPGNIPDEVTVTAPPGYTVDPPVTIIPEDADRVVRVRLIPVS